MESATWPPAWQKHQCTPQQMLKTFSYFMTVMQHGCCLGFVSAYLLERVPLYLILWLVAPLLLRKLWLEGLDFHQVLVRGLALGTLQHHMESRSTPIIQSLVNFMFVDALNPSYMFLLICFPRHLALYFLASFTAVTRCSLFILEIYRLRILLPGYLSLWLVFLCLWKKYLLHEILYTIVSMMLLHTRVST